MGIYEKISKYILVPALVATALTFSYCKKPLTPEQLKKFDEGLQTLKVNDENLKKNNKTLEELTSEVQDLKNIKPTNTTVIQNYYDCPSEQSGSQTGQTGSYGVNLNPCGIKSCTIPAPYINAINTCLGHDHCGTNTTESIQEQNISANAIINKKVDLNNNASVTGYDEVTVLYKPGFNGPLAGLKLHNIGFLVQNLDDCNQFVVLKRQGDIPYQNAMVIEYGKDDKGKLYRIATAARGNGSCGNKKTTQTPRTGDCICSPTLVCPPCPTTQTGPVVPPVTEPVKSTTPEIKVPIKQTLNLPTLQDNSWNYFTNIDWSPELGSRIPEQFQINVCEGGTDNSGNVTKLCTDENVIGLDFVLTATRLSTSEYQGKILGNYELEFMPDIPGNQTQTATYGIKALCYSDCSNKNNWTGTYLKGNKIKK